MNKLKELVPHFEYSTFNSTTKPRPSSPRQGAPQNTFRPKAAGDREKDKGGVKIIADRDKERSKKAQKFKRTASITNILSDAARAPGL
jgi:hypothetical protein